MTQTLPSLALLYTIGLLINGIQNMFFYPLVHHTSFGLTTVCVAINSIKVLILPFFSTCHFHIHISLSLTGWKAPIHSNKCTRVAVNFISELLQFMVYVLILLVYACHVVYDANQSLHGWWDQVALWSSKSSLQLVTSIFEGYSLPQCITYRTRDVDFQFLNMIY